MHLKALKRVVMHAEFRCWTAGSILDSVPNPDPDPDPDPGD